MGKKKIVKRLKELEDYDILGEKDLDSTKDYQDFNQAYDIITNQKKKKKIKRILLFLTILFLVSLSGLGIWYCLEKNFSLEEIKVLNYDQEKELVTLEVTYKSSAQDIFCAVGKTEEAANFIAGTNNRCQLTVEKEAIKTLYLKNSKSSLKTYPVTSLVLKADLLTDDIIYLALDETYNLLTDYQYIGSKQDLTLEVTDKNVASLQDTVIRAQEYGKTTIKMYVNNELYDEKEVVVTPLITKRPTTFKADKPYLPCNKYTASENETLDEILASRISMAGYGTRAGVVEAARFLLLSFPYRIDYFFENGRINSTGVNYADGEGRYYHQGLYLSQDKFDDLKYVYAGPATWGCPLTNYENYGRKYIAGGKNANGLDCSGFLSWAMLNGGFDVGDIGAGETYEPFQFTDLGQRLNLTDDLVDSGKIKVGDLLNWWGHIAIIVGIDADNYYVAESLQTYDGLVINTYAKEDLASSWTYVMLMDSVYKDDGNLQNMWH